MIIDWGGEQQAYVTTAPYFGTTPEIITGGSAITIIDVPPNAQVLLINEDYQVKLVA